MFVLDVIDSHLVTPSVIPSSSSSVNRAIPSTLASTSTSTSISVRALRVDDDDMNTISPGDGLY